MSGYVPHITLPIARPGEAGQGESIIVQVAKQMFKKAIL